MIPHCFREDTLFYMQAAPRPGLQRGVDIRKGAQSTALIPMRIQYAVAYCFNVRLTTARTHNPYGFVIYYIDKRTKSKSEITHRLFYYCKKDKVIYNR